MQVFVGSDNVVELQGLKDKVTGVYSSTATVTATVLDASGQIIATTTLTYVAASQGTYRGSISGASLSPGESYTLQVVAVTGQATMTLRHKLSADYYSGRP